MCGMKTKTTLLVDDELLNKAQMVTGLTTKAAVVQAALEGLVVRESTRQLLGGIGVVKGVRHRRPRVPG